MNRRDALEKALAEFDHLRTGTPDYAFEDGFNAAWDALLSEIRPLVDTVLSAHPQGDAHYEASKRLRELVRESGQ